MLMQDTLDEWLVCQKGWMYLESIFGAPDIQRQLPNENRMFQAVDKSWKAIMRLTHDEPLALKSSTVEGRKDTFISHNAASGPNSKESRGLP